MMIKLNYVRAGTKPNHAQQEATEKMVRSIGYDPNTRVHYIDKRFNEIPFRLYSIYRKDVERYVRGKMKRRHWGYFKKIERFC